MKVRQTNSTAKKTTSEIDLFSDLVVQPTKAQKETISKEVGDFLVEQIWSNLGSAQSPVEGEDFPKLSKKYKAFKTENGGSGNADLLFRGDMQNAIDYKITDYGIELGVFGAQAPKADGHNKFSGKENGTPKRRFLPDENQDFNKDISKEVDNIIGDILIEAQISKEDLKDVNTKDEFWDYMKGLMSGFSKKEIRGAITRSVVLTELLSELDLLDFVE